MYDRESAAWERRRDEPAHRALVERTADEVARFTAPPGPIADLGCGPGAHARALAQRGYAVTGLDGSPRMVAVARDRVARDGLDVTFDVADVGGRLPFADAFLGGALAVLVVQHLPDPASFVAEIRRCLRPGGHLLLAAPDRQIAPVTTPKGYWRIRAATATHVPGLVRFYNSDSLGSLVEAQGFTVVKQGVVGGSVNLIAFA